ncbi:MAG: ribonuclease PH [Prochlorothrix sp.]|nr:ribonuclease PH [Prochlorothrix sp.]
MAWQRPDGRTPQQLRPIQFHRQFTQFAPGSVLVEFGQTRVLCTVTVAAGVPRFLADSGRGWLTAEYRMLPGATQERQSREWLKLSGRTQEIQRLIGRSLRAALDFEMLGEYTLTVDADVLQADGGTRTAAITGGFVALEDAIARLMEQGALVENPIQRSIAAVSVGLLDGEAFLDLNYPEDVAAEVDLNVVMTEDLALIEIQGTAEERQFSRSQLNQMLDLAEGGIKTLINLQKAQPGPNLA